MSFCYRIPYADRFGKHVATKWGDTPAEALARVRKAHDIPGRGLAEYVAPELVTPQPFADRLPPCAPLVGSTGLGV